MAKLSTSEKWEFLGSLYKYGLNKNQINLELEGWNEEKFLKAVKSYKARATRYLNAQKETDGDSLHMWFSLAKNCHEIEGTDLSSSQCPSEEDEELVWKDYSFLLHKSFLYAAAFEEHYQGKTPDEPNYNEIYLYLAQLLAGEAPTQLRPANAKKIIEMTAKLNEMVTDKKCVQRYLSYLSEKHSVSYLCPGVDVWDIVKKKKTQPSQELQEDDLPKMLADLYPEGTNSTFDFDRNNPQFKGEEDGIPLKLHLKQRAIANSVTKIPGMNPLEMDPTFLVKLVESSPQKEDPSPAPRKRKLNSEEKCII